MACRSKGWMQWEGLYCCILALSTADFVVWITACHLFRPSPAYVLMQFLSFFFFLTWYAHVICEEELALITRTEIYNVLPVLESIVLCFMLSVFN